VIGRDWVGTDHIGTGRGIIAQVVVIALASALGLGLAVVGRAPVTHAAAHEISIVDFAFEPAELTVFTGEPVTWTNNGTTSHTVTSDAGTELDSGPIGPGESFGHVFATPGTFTYHCAFHSTRMVATIIVKAAPVTPVPSGPVAPTPPAGTLPPNFSPFPSTGPLPTPSPTPSPTPAAPPTPGPSASSSPSDGGGIGGFLGTLLVVIVVGGVATYLVRSLARKKAVSKAGPGAGSKGGPKADPKDRGSR
jgi:plastocyanin